MQGTVSSMFFSQHSQQHYEVQTIIIQFQRKLRQAKHLAKSHTTSNAGSKDKTQTLIINKSSDCWENYQNYPSS